jgi:hypothetical protein
MFYPASDLVCGFAALLTICLLGGFAAAQGMGGAMADKVQIELRGHIVPRCDITGAAASLDLGTIAETGAQGHEQLKFELSCNAPFAYQLSSEHGAMRHESGSADVGFVAVFPYRATLTILTDSGGTLSLDCASAQLGEPAGTCTGTSGDETSIDKDVSLTVSWGPIEGKLMAGRYSDDLRIAFSIEN